MLANHDRNHLLYVDVIKVQTQKKPLENGHEITNYNYFQCEINIIIRPDATKV